jgi:hypothetical protein
MSRISAKMILVGASTPHDRADHCGREAARDCAYEVSEPSTLPVLRLIK